MAQPVPVSLGLGELGLELASLFQFLRNPLFLFMPQPVQLAAGGHQLDVYLFQFVLEPLVRFLAHRLDLAIFRPELGRQLVVAPRQLLHALQRFARPFHVLARGRQLAL